jgi:hypothetical protein
VRERNCDRDSDVFFYLNSFETGFSWSFFMPGTMSKITKREKKKRHAEARKIEKRRRRREKSKKNDTIS